MTRKRTAASIALTVAASGLLLTSPAGASAPTTLAVTGLVDTHFAMGTAGYSTRIVGGQIPASSGSTAYQVIGCTNVAGKLKTNYEAQLDAVPLLQVSAAKTTVRTIKNGSTVAAWGRNRIAAATIGDSTTPGTVTVEGIQSTSKAFHNGTGFHATTAEKVLDVKFDADGPGYGEPVSLGVPLPGQPIDIPGVATISLGTHNINQGAHSASAKSAAVKIYIYATNTTVYLAHSRANISDGVVEGVFTGNSYGSKIEALDETLRSKMTPYIVMPCQGTKGNVQTKDVALINPSNVVLEGLTTAQVADQVKGKAYIWERGGVAKLNLGQGSLVVKGVVGKARVDWVLGKGFTKSIKGTTFLSITSNGQSQTVPDSGVLEIPGVARIEQNIVKRTRTTITVTALRITVLDGTGAVINLGRAKAGFHKSAF